MRCVDPEPPRPLSNFIELIGSIATSIRHPRRRVSAVKFGLFHLFAVPQWTNAYDIIKNEFEQIKLGEKLGYNSIWLAEHNARPYGVLGDVTMGAAAVATCTSRIRIVTAVTRNPLHHPLQLAQNLAFVDNLSNGRLDWGVGKGYDQFEFETYGIPYAERDARWEDALIAVQKMWKSGRTGYQGRFHHCADGKFYPEPLQRPGPAIYLCVSKSDESVKVAAKRLWPVAFGQGPSWADARHKLELYAETASAAGYSDDAIREALSRCWQTKQIHVSHTTEQAIAEAEKPLMWFYDEIGNRAMFGFDTGDNPYEYYVKHGSVILGSKEKVLDELGAFAEQSGIQNVVCFFNVGGTPHGNVVSTMEIFASDIMPELNKIKSPFTYVGTTDAASGDGAPGGQPAVATVP
jgi:alkanesulfonate monooxygenase SsuD/methylene tetrahydromethanopterin reductase-like flavin-dependent oxidoreductase (luciferase family)